jgi:hypothetical protein
MGILRLQGRCDGEERVPLLGAVNGAQVKLGPDTTPVFAAGVYFLDSSDLIVDES